MISLRFRDRAINEVMKSRQVLRACEHAAGIVAPFCEPAEVELYVRTCTRAERAEKLYDWLISMVSAFAAPAFILSIDGGGGLIAGAIFIALWAFFGIGQTMTHKAELHALAVADATARLCEAVKWTPEELAARGVRFTIISKVKK